MKLQDVLQPTELMVAAMKINLHMTVKEFEAFLQGYRKGTFDAQQRALGLVRDEPVDRIGQNPFMEEERS